MEIRKAKIEDSIEILELLKQVLEVHVSKRSDIFKENSTKYNLEEVKKIIEDKDKLVFVASDENHVLAYAICLIKETKNHNSLQDCKELFIDDFCVDKNHKRKHIGTKLYQYVKKYSLENNFNKITLHVWSFNKEAIEFYRSLGMNVMYYMMEDNN